MKAAQILRLIPTKNLEILAAESKVNTQVKKLDGITMFRLALFSMLHSDKASLRVMESIFHSMQFRMISGLKNETTKFNSIRDRIATINSNFFEQIFSSVFDTFSKYFQEESEILRYDSTMIAISSKLVEWGMKVGSKTNKVQLKYTIGMKGSFPCQVKIYDQPEALCEDKTIPPAILENAASKNSIVVFDRGVQKRKAWVQLTDENISFVTRVKTDIRHKIISKKSLFKTSVKSAIIIKEDSQVQLMEAQEKWVNKNFRLVKAIIRESKEPIYFLTNINNISADEVAALYKRRWDIEVLFKFLKQHLNLNHVFVRNENGIRVMIYMTLILSILLIAYKKLNKVSSYKIAKLKFSNELESAIVKQIVLLCDGNPNKMKHLFNDS